MVRIFNPLPALAALLTLLISLVVFNCNSNQESSPEKEAAINSARHWIALIDSGKYEQSWQTASDAFKADVTRRQWRIALEQIRAPYGQVRTRKIKETKPLEDGPGKSRQENLVIEFATLFEDEERAAEFVTVMLDKDGAWRVSAYYLDR